MQTGNSEKMRHSRIDECLTRLRVDMGTLTQKESLVQNLNLVFPAKPRSDAGGEFRSRARDKTVDRGTGG